MFISLAKDYAGKNKKSLYSKLLEAENKISIIVKTMGEADNE